MVLVDGVKELPEVNRRSKRRNNMLIDIELQRCGGGENKKPFI
jgi:hypothetical protein